ncbi:MAG TPA: ABC transporter permease [Mycobacteriales bacterium]|jgi:branched-chain amino acid transport system permease protein|nr:ABC transporter permease [Mycobacteriales bacterium]
MSALDTGRRPLDGELAGKVTSFASSTKATPTIVRRIVIAGLFLLVVQSIFHLSPQAMISGVSLGGLYGIIGVGIVLTYRTSRVINFAAAAVGAVPAITAVLLSTAHGVSYLLTMPIAIVGGVLFGALTDILVLRRFKRTSRLVVTVVTIGIAQSYAALGFFIPVWFGEKASRVPRVKTPWQDWMINNHRGEPVLTGNQVFAFAVVVILTGVLVFFLKKTRLGIALRASSENAERAALLGMPVARVSTIAWAFAGLLSSMAIFSIAPLYGVPADATLGFNTLLYGLAAAVVAKMENLTVSLITGVGIGLLIVGSNLKTGDESYSYAMMIVIIYAALLTQRKSRSRAIDANASSWQTIAVFRPIPLELRDLPEVIRMRSTLLVVGLALAIGLPYVINPSDMSHLQLLPIFGIVGVSLVILTGWAGQISLGQFGLVGIASAAAGGLAGNHNIDFFAALGIGIAAGALTAVIIGLPAVRIQGLFLAVTTLAFGYTMQYYILNSHYWIGSHLLPNPLHPDIRRPTLYGKFDLEDEKSFYFLCVGLLILCLLAAASFRRQHSGRMLIALRDNQRAAASYSIAPVRTRLSAFAISGGFAGVAGVLMAYQQHNVIPGTYDVLTGIGVFLAAAVGGLGSLMGGTLSVIAFEATVLFGPLAWHHLGHTISDVMPLLLTGPLLIINLYTNPGGLAGWVFEERDKWLRRLAKKHGIHVPSLLADRRVDDTDATMPEPLPVSLPEPSPEAFTEPELVR